MTAKVLQFAPLPERKNYTPSQPEPGFPGFSRTTKDFKCHRISDLEIWELNADLADCETALKFIERQGSCYLPSIRGIFADLHSGRIPSGDSVKGEIEIIGVGRIEVSRFRLVVDYIVLTSPSVGSYHVDYYQQVGRFRETAAAAMIALTSERLVPLVRQYRHSLRDFTLEIPRGTREDEESSEQCALREAQEEAGIITTTTSELIDLGEYYPDTGMIASQSKLICATNVEVIQQRQKFDRNESIHSVQLLAPAELMERISRGEINDGYTATAALRAWGRGIF